MKLSTLEVGDARAVLLAGPTGSGKSAAARRFAEALAGRNRVAWIVNADSMQVYDALRVLTARPDADEEAGIPHRLYGHVAAERRYSVAAWLEDMAAVLGEAERKGALPIVVGGTGLYFRALTQGLAAIPPIGAEVRASWGERLKAHGAAALHSQLNERDPATAATIRPSDAQRILRALEVLDSTGRPVREWAQAPPLLRAGSIARLYIEPRRDVLYRRISERVETMVRTGAIEEVGALLRRGLDPDLPVMRAIGVKEIAAFLRGEASLGNAVAMMQTRSRQYAKRQLTWLRNQMPDWDRVGE